jgi:hypothetical protein
MADTLGLDPRVVRLVEYHAQWPALFVAEGYMNAKSSYVHDIFCLARAADI